MTGLGKWLEIAPARGIRDRLIMQSTVFSRTKKKTVPALDGIGALD
jgi:hypothetical protein